MPHKYQIEEFGKIIDKRIYSSEEGENLKDKLVKCDMESCQDQPCLKRGGYGLKSHIYNDVEDFSECCWPGKTGFAIEVQK